jgi:circadian clock protein KaiC
MREVEDLFAGAGVRRLLPLGGADRAPATRAWDLQHFVQELGTRMTSWQATTFLIGEYTHCDVEANPIITVADGMIALAQVQDSNRGAQDPRRQDARPGPHGRLHTCAFRRGPAHLSAHAAAAGRRPQPGCPGRPRSAPHLDRRAGLDELMHGGLPQGHTMLVSGPTGSGKTILGTRFLQEGARQGEKGVAMYFEKGTARLRNAELAEMIQNGHVTVVESRCPARPDGGGAARRAVRTDRAHRRHAGGDRFAVRVRPVPGARIPRDLRLNRCSAMLSSWPSAA